MLALANVPAPARQSCSACPAVSPSIHVVRDLPCPLRVCVYMCSYKGERPGIDLCVYVYVCMTANSVRHLVAHHTYRWFIHSAAQGRRGLQGDCSEDPLGSLPVPRRPGQCVVTVREDFLEANPGPDSLVWLSGLYVYTLGLVDKNQGTVLASHTDLFLTDMTLVAQGHKARGVEVQENQTIFMAGARSASVRRCVWCS